MAQKGWLNSRVLLAREGPLYCTQRGRAQLSLVQPLCGEEGVGFVDVWDCFAGRADKLMRDGIHPSSMCLM